MTTAKDIRLLLSDVDGTMVTNDKVLTDAAQSAAAALNSAGIALAITSSRPPRGMRMLVEPMKIVLPMGGCNGGVLVAPDMSVIETHLIDASASQRIVDFLLKQGLDVWVYTETQWLVRDPNGPHVAREQFILQFPPEVVSAYTTAQINDAIKIVGVSDDFGLIASSEAAAQSLLGDTASATRSAPHFLDVTNPLANKGQMVHTLAKRLNIAPSQIATIGDMQNDVLMFKQGGFSIAMGNAADDVKAQADVVTDSNQEDGFAKAIHTFLLAGAGA